LLRRSLGGGIAYIRGRDGWVVRLRLSTIYGHSLDLAVPLCRWSIAVMVELYKGPKRFSELRRSLGVSNRVLAYKLKILRTGGVVDRVLRGDAPIYVLTNHGVRVAEVFHSLSPLEVKMTALVNILRSKWMSGILIALWREELTPVEIMARVRGITWKVLSENLKKLESFGLVERDIVATRPVRVRYGLTSRGRSLIGWLVRNGIM